MHGFPVTATASPAALLRSVSRSTSSSASSPPTSPPLLQVTNTGGAPVPRATVATRYSQAHALLGTPWQGRTSLQDALLAVLRGEDAGNGAARDALVLCLLPWERVCALVDGGCTRLAPWSLMLMLQHLFTPEARQGRQLVPLVKAHGHRLSLAQWVDALALPRHRRGGALALDAVRAAAARLQSLPCPHQWEEDTAAPLLMATLLPAWPPADTAQLLKRWQDDPRGWSLADAAVRARDLQQTRCLGNADTLAALDAERHCVPATHTPIGRMADAIAGLCQVVFGADPLAFADRVMAAAGSTPAHTPVGDTVTWQGRSRRLQAMDQRMQDASARRDFYADALPRLMAGIRAHQQAAAEPPTVPGRAPHAEVDPAVPDHLDSPGRLTVLGRVSNAEPSLPLRGILSFASGATLVPRRSTSDSGGSTVSAPPVPGTTAVEGEVTLDVLEDSVPAWVSGASDTAREHLQHLLDLQAAWNEVLTQTLAALQSLQAFTRSRLADAIAVNVPESGLDPASVTVTVTEHAYAADIPGGFLDMAAPWPVASGGQPPVLSQQTMTLDAFAIRNAAPDWMPAPTLTITAEGRDPSGRILRLAQHEVVKLVRDADVGGRFEAYLREVLLGSRRGPLQQAWVESTRAGLVLALQVARMRGTVFPQDFFMDAQGQDLLSQMVAHVIAHPDAATRPLLGTHHVEVFSLGIGFGTATRSQVNGIWLVQMRHPERGITDVVVLAPGVPDGNEVRVYETLRAAQADPYWRGEEGYAWLQRQMSLHDQQGMATLTDRDDPVKSLRPASRAFFTPEKMRFERVEGDFLVVGYQDMAGMLIANADVQTTSTQEIDWRSAWSFAAEQILLLGDVASVLPVMRLLRPLRWLGRIGKAGNPVKTLPFTRITRLDDGRIGVLASPTKAPDWNGLENLQQRLRTLSLKQAGTLTAPEQIEVKRLTTDIAALRTAYARQYAGPVTVNRVEWWACMDAIPDLAGVGEAGRVQYVSYLLSQRSPPEVRALLRNLKEKGVDKVMPTLRSLHTRAMQLVDDGRRGPAAPPQAGPSGSVGKHASSERQGGSPKKKLSQPLEDRGGALPPPSAYPFEVVPESHWPTYLHHYTTRDNYNAMMAQGFSHLEPSSVNPMGALASGPVPRIVYVTPMGPEHGRRAIADALFGRAQFHSDRGDKVARVITLDTRNLPAGTQIAHYMDRSHQQVYAIGVPGNGAITLRDADDALSVRVVPPKGAEVVPVV